MRIPDTLTPADAAKKLAALSGGKAPQYREGERYYTVRKGDTLYRISRRYGVSTSALIMANEIDGANRIYIGQVLRIPGKVVAAAPTKTAKPVAESIAKSLPKPAPRPKPVKKTVVASASASALKRPVTDASTEDFDATIYSLGVKVIAAGSKAVITVSIGENLGLYAGWLNVPVSQIRRLNHGRRNVRLNQRIRIPLKNGQQSLQQFKARRLEYHMAEEEDFYSQYHVAEIKYHRVRSGDTVWSICSNEEETPLWLLKKFNRGVNIEALSVDAKLAVPVITSRQDSASGDVAVTAASNK